MTRRLHIQSDWMSWRKFCYFWLCHQVYIVGVGRKIGYYFCTGTIYSRNLGYLLLECRTIASFLSLRLRNKSVRMAISILLSYHIFKKKKRVYTGKEIRTHRHSILVVSKSTNFTRYHTSIFYSVCNLILCL